MIMQLPPLDITCTESMSAKTQTRVSQLPSLCIRNPCIMGWKWHSWNWV